MLATHQKKTLLNVIMILTGFVFLLVLYRTAWLSDDAYISYRSVENFVEGYGLTFNPGQRVQAFTHPLWAMIHIPFRCLFENMYAIGLGISMLTSIIAVGLLIRYTSPYREIRIWLLLAIISSAAFMDYSTSGLENPLTHLLLILFASVYLSEKKPNHQLLKASVIAGLMLLNRMDTVLLIAPVLGMLWWQQKSVRTSLIVLLGLLPFIFWEIFAIIYYGFPFPMTAYAKLNTSISRSDLLIQGAYYFLDAMREDPLTMMLLVSGMLAPFFFRQKKYYMLSLGMGLYLLYTLYIGGDFMRGRFFCSPFFLALIVLAGLIPRHLSGYLALIVIIAGFLGSNPPILSHANLGKEEGNTSINRRGIANERAYYFQGTGLIAAKGRKLPDQKWVETGKQLRNSTSRFAVTGNMGFIGYFAGPEKHIIDWYALTDPFLAQLPNVYQPNWRPGHNKRLIPRGYISSLSSGENQLFSPQLKEVYAAIQQITRKPVWNSQRLKTIWEINFTRKYSQLIDKEFYTLPIAVSIPESDLTKLTQQPILAHADAGLEIVLDKQTKTRTLELLLQSDCEFVCAFRNGKQIIKGSFLQGAANNQGISRFKIPISNQKTNNIVIFPNMHQDPCKIIGIQLVE